MTRTRPTFTILWAALALLVPTASRGQACDLPGPIISATTLSDDQKKQIQDCVATNVRLLESADPAEVKRGREALLKPLQNGEASVTFRLRYSEAAAPELERLAAQQNDPKKAINALIVAGALATTQAANILRKFQEDQRVAVRFTATASCKRIFIAIEGAAPAMAKEDAARIVDDLGRRCGQEQDPDVFDAGVRSLITAGQITRPQFADVRLQALRVLAQQADQRVRQLPIAPAADRDLASLVRAGGALRDAAANNQIDLPDETSRFILEFGADLWAHMVKRLEARQFPVVQPGDEPAAAEAKRAARSIPVQVVQIGQVAMFFAATNLGDARAIEQVKQAADWVGQATPDGDAMFTRRARELIGPGGILSKPPLFNYPNDRFLAK